jgi:hypothetical protein
MAMFVLGILVAFLISLFDMDDVFIGGVNELAGTKYTASVFWVFYYAAVVILSLFEGFFRLVS